MIHIVYASAAMPRPSRDALLDLLRISRRNNGAAGVTGLLLYSGGTYFQALEGPEAAVEQTFRRISRDPCHTGIEILLREEKAQRDFPEWAMGFRHVGGLAEQDRAAFSPFLHDGRFVARRDGASRRVRALFQSFRSMAMMDLQ
jgi:hypothetical protein